MKVYNFFMCKLLLALGILCVFPIYANAQIYQLRGHVKDSNGEPIIGATVLQKDTHNGTITDIDGNFMLDVSDKSTIVISYVGYSDQTIVLRGQKNIEVILKDDVMALDELVVVGYGVVKKSDLTGSVSSVKSDVLDIGLSQSPDQALRSKVPGVQIVSVSGQPGSGAMVRIRGNSSITGSNEPLYVVDGVPFSGGGSSPGTEGTDATPLTSINPSDIEKIEVLKDASSTAIYGSRGANGVILITTKQGKEGKVRVNLDVKLGVQTVDHKLDLTNAQEFATMWNEYVDFRNTGTKYDLNNLPADTDWQSLMLRKAQIQSYNLSFSGGTEKLKYMLSGGFTSQDGIVINTGYKRYTFRSNLDSKINNWLTIGSNISANRTETDLVKQSSINADNPVSLMTISNPLVPCYDEDGNYTKGTILADSDKGNPVATMKQTDNNSINTKFSGNFYAVMDLMKGLQFRTNFATDLLDSNGYYYSPSSLLESENAKGKAVIGHRSKSYWNFTNTLTYNVSVKEIHNITAMLGAEWQKDVTRTVKTNAQTFPNDNGGYDAIGQASSFSSTSSYSAWQMASYLGRFNYSYKNKYLATVTARLDGSSKFGINNKYAFFPSLALAWRVNEEDFMKSFDWLSNLKMRISYGRSGEQGINAYQTLSVLGSSNIWIGDQLYTTFSPSRNADPDLSWEKTDQLDLGIDFGVLNNRLNFVFDAYYKKTTDLLYPISIPGSSGFTSQLKNVGSMENKGFEFALNALLINSKDFSWDIGLNTSINRNKVLDLGPGNDKVLAPEGAVSGGNISGNPCVLIVGKPVGVFYGYISDGVIYDEAESLAAKEAGQTAYYPGELKIRDITGEGKITTDDKTVIGDSNPDFIGGMTNTLRYKGFQLDMQFQWVYGNDILNYQHAQNQRISTGNNSIKEWFDSRWTEENPSRTQPRAGYDERAYVDCTYHVFDGSYFRVNNLTLSYNFPTKILKKIYLDNLKLSFSVDNVYTFTKYNGWTPDINSFGENVVAQGIDAGTYPLPRTYTLGLKIGF